MTVAAAPTVPMAARLMRLADWLAVAVAVSLPWSTSVTGVLAGAWVVVALCTLRSRVSRPRALHGRGRPAGGDRALRDCCGGVADVAWPLRMRSLPAVIKLLVIPLLFIHFRRTGAAGPVFAGFFLSCCVLLAASWLIVLFPSFPLQTSNVGVPVKVYISQSGFFSICIVALLDRAITVWRGLYTLRYCVLAAAAVFFANIIFVATVGQHLSFSPCCCSSSRDAIPTLATAAYFSERSRRSPPYRGCRHLPSPAGRQCRAGNQDLPRQRGRYIVGRAARVLDPFARHHP